ncbi:MAG: heme NO-binding domain-containing protein [Acidimicrobiales bacterium]
MKGVVFNIVQEVVEEHLGPQMWDDAVDRSDVEGAYTSLGNYPDADLEQLVGSLGELSHLSRSDVLVFAGRQGFQQLAGRHPDLIAPYSGWRDVVEHLDDIIHPEVAKIYPDADTPSFTTTAQPDGSVHMVYESRRQLCSLAEGLVLGLGDWFRCTLAVAHVECVRMGGPSCTLSVIQT